MHRPFMVQVAQELRREGLQLMYMRVPMSRNRPPLPVDLEELHNSAFAGGPDVKANEFVVIAKSASTSTSCAYVAHFLEIVLAAVEDSTSDFPPGSSSPRGLSPSLLEPSPAGSSLDRPSIPRLMGEGELASGANPRRPSRPVAERISNSTISNLCRHVQPPLLCPVFHSTVTSCEITCFCILYVIAWMLSKSFTRLFGFDKLLYRWAKSLGWIDHSVILHRSHLCLHSWVADCNVLMLLCAAQSLHAPELSQTIDVGNAHVADRCSNMRWQPMAVTQDK
jgi:hypothetical protein